MPDTVIASYRTCNNSEVKNLPIEKGTMILAKDTGNMYADTIDGDRVPISRQTAFVTEAQRQAMLAPEEEILYITIDDFKIWIYFNNNWSCLTKELKLNFLTTEDIDIICGITPPPETETPDTGDGNGEDSGVTDGGGGPVAPDGTEDGGEDPAPTPGTEEDDPNDDPNAPPAEPVE